MKLVTRQEGGEVQVGESLTVTVLEICKGKVKLGFSSLLTGSSETGAVRNLARIYSNGSGYYHFLNTGSRMLVLERTKGKWMTISEFEQLVIVDVRRAAVTLALCTVSERGRYEYSGSPPARERIPVLGS